VQEVPIRYPGDRLKESDEPVVRWAQFSSSHAEEVEAHWIDACRAGDMVAFNRIVRKWQQRVFNMAFRMLQDFGEAEDATQEIFVAAFRGIDRFQHRSRFSTWLYRISMNKLLTRLERRPDGLLSLDVKATRQQIAGSLRISGDQEGRILEDERRHRILVALSKLSAAQRPIIELKFFQDQTFDEIASILDLPVSTVKSRFYAALNVLKEHLTVLEKEDGQ